MSERISGRALDRVLAAAIGPLAAFIDEPRGNSITLRCGSPEGAELMAEWLLVGKPEVVARIGYDLRDTRVALDSAQRELSLIDSVLARRPALAECDNRRQKIEHAINVAARADDAQRALESSKRTNATLVDQVTHWERRATEALAAVPDAEKDAQIAALVAALRDASVLLFAITDPTLSADEIGNVVLREGAHWSNVHRDIASVLANLPAAAAAYTADVRRAALEERQADFRRWAHVIETIVGHRAHRTSCSSCDPARELVGEFRALAAQPPEEK